MTKIINLQNRPIILSHKYTYTPQITMFYILLDKSVYSLSYFGWDFHESLQCQVYNVIIN